MAAEHWVIDLDGVIWLLDTPIPGSAEAIAELRAAGIGTAFFTNNSFPHHAELLERLHRVGIEAAPEELLSSPQAAALCCRAGERALVVGGEGIVEALEAAGVPATRAREATDDDEFDVVVVGIDPHFDYPTLSRAMHVVRAGARLVATNDDATFPLPGGIVPGAGAVLAAVSTAAGAVPEIAGKPYPPSARLVNERVGEVSLVVGDRVSTDGRLAAELGRPFALVLSGVPNGPGPYSPEPVRTCADLATLVKEELAWRMTQPVE